MIIDSHTHIFSPEISARREYYCSRDACFSALYFDSKAKISHAADLIRSMDEACIDKSVIQNIGWVNQDMCERNNDYIIESVLKYPDRLIGFCSVQPLEQDNAISELERCFKAGLRGVGELRPDVQGYDLSNKELLSPLIDIIIKNNAVMSIHASEPVGHAYNGKGETGPGVLYSFIQQHTGLNVILAHFGGGLPFYQLMPEVNTALENTYYDTAAAPFLYKPDIYPVVNRICGSGRLLFGSDWPLLDQSRAIKHLDAGGLNDADRANILFNNAARLFKLDAM
jgi:uncharacterized protein